jgi:hypothetical protein
LTAPAAGPASYQRHIADEPFNCLNQKSGEIMQANVERVENE